MSMRDQDVIQNLGQVRVRQARQFTVVLVSDERIGKDAHVLRFDQKAGMIEITHANAVAVILVSLSRRIGSEQRAKLFIVIIGKTKSIFDVLKGLGSRSHREKIIEGLVIEGHVNMDPMAVGKTGGHVQEGAIIGVKWGKIDRLAGRIVVGTVVQQALDKKNRWLV